MRGPRHGALSRGLSSYAYCDAESLCRPSAKNEDKNTPLTKLKHPRKEQQARDWGAGVLSVVERSPPASGSVRFFIELPALEIVSLNRSASSSHWLQFSYEQTAEDISLFCLYELEGASYSKWRALPPVRWTLGSPKRASASIFLSPTSRSSVNMCARCRGVCGLLA